ncbi:Ger(x)C family spore germination C-terminal domain-containing protein [Brevibacillus nitrificans]|uniref:Ger(x)C family spore germination protein n=1 Tax=Brevibacillus nitrificans TaxID=651560 RepID=UPI00286597F9|nr:Ger(x)C family spore germination C-terminal domain-containing protein [Brevibacillus nitrificans]MDR7319011.1 spore germination protein [Brevibacillus nitrificans]
MRGGFLFLMLILAGAISLSGCAPQFERPSLEDMAMIGVIGFDFTGNTAEVKVSVSIPIPSSKEREVTQSYTAVSEVASEALVGLSTMAEQSMSLSQLRVILISEEYARKVGINKVILDLYRNPIVGENVFVAIVKGRAEDVIKATYEHKPELNTYLNYLLRPRVETAFSSFTTIKDFVFMLTCDCGDPNMPYLMRKANDVIVSKVALFHRDKMIGFLSQREGKLVQAMLGKRRLPRMSFHFPITPTGSSTHLVNRIESNAEQKSEQVVLDFVWAKGRARSNGSQTNPRVHIKLEMRATIVGYTGNDSLDNKAQFEALRRKIEGQIKKEAVAMLLRFQKAGVDPAQLEESFRQKYRGKWDRTVGMRIYEKAGFDVDVSMEIIAFGTMN